MKHSWKYEHAQRYFKQRAELYDVKYIPKGAEELSRILIQKAEIKEGDFVLDFATGTGFQAVQIAYAVREKGRVLGLDISKEMLQEAETKIKRLGLYSVVKLKKMESDTIPLEEDSVDAIICGFAYHHFPDPYRVTAEMFRVLKPYKKAVVVDGCRPEHPFKKLIADLSVKISDRTWHIRFYTENEFREFFEKSGFKEVHSWCFYQTHCLLYPFIMIEGTKHHPSTQDA
jgi:demethylmenaquinone methyltransferase/2-methoxy-6-polyprenyl-1,4-benzoquinol methylase